jgi:hypothetical protein
MVSEKNLLMYWADKCQNATIISGKMESCFGSSAPSYFWGTKLLLALKRDEDIFEVYERSGKPQDPLAGLEFLKSTAFASIPQISTTSRTEECPKTSRTGQCPKPAEQSSVQTPAEQRSVQNQPNRGVSKNANRRAVAEEHPNRTLTEEERSKVGTEESGVRPTNCVCSGCG